MLYEDNSFQMKLNCIFNTYISRVWFPKMSWIFSSCIFFCEKNGFQICIKILCMYLTHPFCLVGLFFNSSPWGVFHPHCLISSKRRQTSPRRWTNIWPNDMWPTDIWQTDIWPNDIWPTDIWPNDIWPTDIWSNDILLIDIWPTSI
jgi:hypothetical protein